MHHPDKTVASASKARLTRFVLPLSSPGHHVAGVTLADTPVELMTVHYERVNTKPYQFAYGLSLSPTASFYDELIKVDVNSGEVTRWSQSGCSPGEPIFVPAPDTSDDEDAGVLLSVVLDATAGTSLLAVIDAKTMKLIASAAAPNVVPLGFHGRYYADLP